MAANRKNSGFSLLELLVALGIGSLIIVAAYGTFFSLRHVQELVNVDISQRRSLQTTLDLMRRELSSVIYRTDDKKLRFLVKDRDFFGKPASTLSFITIGPPSDGLSSDQILLHYQVTESANKLRLLRSAKDYFLQNDPLPAYPILEEVEGFLVECFDGSKWLKNWDTALTPVLPKAIRITYFLRDKDHTISHRIMATPRISAQ